jgi:hypothetical protein
MTALRVLIPIILGVVAGLINYLVMRSVTTTLDLVAVKDEVKLGTELTPEMFDKVSLRADAKIFRSAVPWSDRGMLVRRRVNRPLRAGEVVLFADVRHEGGEDVRRNLRPGEASLTAVVPQKRMPPGIRPPDEVTFILAPSTEGGEVTGPGRLVGPFRVVGLGDLTDPSLTGRMPRDEGMRKVIVAIPATTPLPPSARALEEALRGRSTERIVALELYRPGAAPAPAPAPEEKKDQEKKDQEKKDQ